MYVLFYNQKKRRYGKHKNNFAICSTCLKIDFGEFVLPKNETPLKCEIDSQATCTHRGATENTYVM